MYGDGKKNKKHCNNYIIQNDIYNEIYHWWFYVPFYCMCKKDNKYLWCT